MYQKCPTCNGTGVDQVSAYVSKDPTCPTCNGKRIIDEITGKPPNQVNATEALEPEFCAGCEGSRSRNLIECDVCGKRLR